MESKALEPDECSTITDDDDVANWINEIMEKYSN